MKAPSTLSVDSTEWVGMGIISTTGWTSASVTSSGGPASTLTPPQLAFTGKGVTPTDDDWVTGEWQPPTGPQLVGTANDMIAAALVGPAGIISLSRGRYDIWARVQGFGAVSQVIRDDGGLVVY